MRIEGVEAGDRFGASVAALGDVNGDGKGDIAVGAIFTNPGGRINAGSIYVISGADGRTIYRVDGERAGAEFGRSLAAVGDLDKDNVSDFIVGAPRSSPEGLADAGAIHIYSGKEGKPLDLARGQVAGWRVGQSVTSNGPSNLAFGAPFASPQDKSNAGWVVIPSYKPGFISGESPGDNFGWSIASAGDVNGDGKPDILVGAPGVGAGAGTDTGRVYMVSSEGSTVLFKVDGDQPASRFGHSVAGIGDVNGDGVADIAVGAPRAPVLGRGNAGKVFVLSGRDGRLLYNLEGPSAGSSFGHALAGAGDMDGDGVSDLLVGAPGFNANAGAVFVFSGRDGKKLYEFSGSPREELGYSVAAGGDINGDGRPDILVGAYSAPGPEGRPNGKVYVLSRP